MTTITLRGGSEAIVDEDMADYLSQWNWRNYRGYAVRDYRDKDRKLRRVYMAREIMKPPKDRCVDHINRNPLDNRRGNLRVCTRGQNAINSLQKGTSSKYKGVCWDKKMKCWRAYIHKQGKRTHLGYHNNEKNAAEAYNKMAEKMHGEYAYLNKI